MTRADKIRNMSDEELGGFIDDLLVGDINPEMFCDELEVAKDGPCEKECTCRDCIIEWLKKEE